MTYYNFYNWLFMNEVGMQMYEDSCPQCSDVYYDPTYQQLTNVEVQDDRIRMARL